MSDEVQYVHRNIKDAVFSLVCLAYPYVKMKGLVDNLHKDCKDQIKVYEREHKALEIINNKGLSTNELWFFKNDKPFEEYTETMRELYFGVEGIDRKLKTKDEFDLLKEVMK